MKDWLRTACCGIVPVGTRRLTRLRAGHTNAAAPVHPVSISTFQSVAGKWAGIMRTTPRSREDDWITVTIREDGAYHL